MPRQRRGAGGVLRSLSLRGVALLAVLVVLPVLLYSLFTRIEDERRALLLTAVRDAGVAIANGLAPELRDLQPGDFGTLGERLARFADARRQVTVLFHPAGSVASEQFFLVGSVPQVAADQLEPERARLATLGVLDQLARSCEGGSNLTERVAGIAGGDAVITSVTGVAGTAGCFAIVVAVNAAQEIAGIAGRPVEVRRDLTLAAVAYALMALLVMAIFASVWGTLRRFRRLAQAPGEAGGFVGVTDVPEMVPVARAIDAMVQRLRDAADLLRRSAEDNAHAFKGPIATIRQAIEPLRDPAAAPESRRTATAAVHAALDRLDGLIRSVRRLDAATADLLEMAQARVDLSALLRGLVEEARTMRAAQRVTISEQIASGVTVLGTDEALESIFENLLENALGFSPPGGVVRVTLVAGEGSVLAKIEDDGPGVAEAALSRIFERYYSDRRAMPQEAALAAGEPTHFGIGLWIARQNARALGGDIAAVNRVPHGLSMRVRLPLAGARPASGAAGDDAEEDDGPRPLLRAKVLRRAE
ncbi:MAG TPA: HAMP domain-containing sensor histidine kinase [Acetobacteraceae bacterium]|nr:HAMP domain-containing sensor histidine kinase [Acetobacteraceae bacterium]